MITAMVQDSEIEMSKTVNKKEQKTVKRFCEVVSAKEEKSLNDKRKYVLYVVVSYFDNIGDEYRKGFEFPVDMVESEYMKQIPMSY